MNIYLPIEVKVRELEGKMLLALEAADRGHNVIIGEKKDTLNFAKAGHLPAGIVHDKSLTPGEYKIKNFHDLKNHGHVITAQDEESGLLDESFDLFAQRRFSEDTVSLADRIFAWGLHDGKSLKKIYPKFENKIVSTGSPRVDFWRKEFDEYYRSHMKREKPYILIASNFGYPIDENPFWNKVARLRKAGYFERDPSMEQYMYENTAYQFRLLYFFVEMIRKLAAELPEIDILVRPHPVESLDAWKKLMGDQVNVIINREGTISGWIRNASALVHNGCTSALEASVSGLPRIAYRPIPHEIEREIPNNTSLHAFSYKELKHMVANILQTGQTEGIEETTIKTKGIITERLSSTEGKMASEKIVDEWETLANKNRLTQTDINEFHEIYRAHMRRKKQKNFKRALKKKAVDIRNIFTGQTRDKTGNGNLLKTSHKFPYLHKNEVDGIISDIQKSLNRFQNISSVQYGKYSYIITKTKK